MDAKYFAELISLLISFLGLSFLLGAAFQRLKSLEAWRDEIRVEIKKIEVMENELKHLATGIDHLEKGQDTILDHLKAHLHLFEKNFDERDRGEIIKITPR